jgi:hypothetical protein
MESKKERPAYLQEQQQLFFFLATFFFFFFAAIKIPFKGKRTVFLFPRQIFLILSNFFKAEMLSAWRR